MIGVAVGATICLRFITLVYFAQIFVCYLLYASLIQRNRAAVIGVMLSLAVASVMAVPILLINRENIVNYYWVGHVSGPERAIRDAGLGFISSIGWLARVTGGALLGWAGGTLLAGYLVTKLFLSGVGPSRDKLSGSARRERWVLVCLFAAVPALTLSLHPAKAPQPLSIIVFPLLWLVLLATLDGPRKRPASNAAVNAVALILGLGLFVQYNRNRGAIAIPDSDARSIDLLVDYVYYASEEGGLRSPRIAVTGLSDNLNPGALNVRGYERHGYWLDMVQTLPTGLLEEKKEVILDRLLSSDFVLIFDNERSGFPFDRSVASSLPQIRDSSAKLLREVGRFPIGGERLSLYESPKFGERSASRSSLTRSIAATGLERGRKPIPPAEPILLGPQYVVVPPGRFEIPLAIGFGPSEISVQSDGEAAMQWLAYRSRMAGTINAGESALCRVTAKNEMGVTTKEMTIEAIDGMFVGKARAGRQALANNAFDIDLSCFDLSGKLNYVDVIDEVSGKVIDRLVPGAQEKTHFSRRVRVAIEKEGPSVLIIRFVRFDEKLAEKYAFVDDRLTVTIAKAPGVN